MSPNVRLLGLARKWAGEAIPKEWESDPIGSLIKGGESEIVEFKTRLPNDDIVAKNLVAFANTKGGVLFIGVGDDGEIIGLSDVQLGSTIWRLQRIAEKLFPYPIEITAVDVSGKTLAYAAVDPAPTEFRPITTSRGEYFQRQHAAAVLGSLDAVWSKRKIEVPEISRREVKAFIAMSFREEEEPALVDYFRAMERAVSSTGLPIKIIRIDIEEGDYEISQGIMNKIDEVDIVIADFTLNSPNVYFELGYARGQRLRVIQTARKGTFLEFDIRNWRTVFYRNATELEEKLVPALKEAYMDVLAEKGQQADSGDAK